MPDSVVSLVNSTTVVLAGAAVFTGTWEDVQHLSSVTVTAIASHASAADGLLLQWSPDNGTTVLTALTTTRTLAAAVVQLFESQILAQYFRVVLTNGATLQTSLNIQTIYRYTASARTIAAANSVIIVPTQLIKTVAATGTPEALAASSTPFTQATLIGLKAARTNNVGIVYFGVTSTNDAQPYAISPGERVVLEAAPGKRLDLATLYVDVLNAGDGLAVIYS